MLVSSCSFSMLGETIMFCCNYIIKQHNQYLSHLNHGIENLQYILNVEIISNGIH